MAALTMVVPTRLGTVDAPANVSASDTISASQLGTAGVYLEIINGNASPDSMTISDAGSTPAGVPLASGNYAVTVTNGSSKVFYISPKQADPASGLVTITHSPTATITYKLYPA